MITSKNTSVNKHTLPIIFSKLTKLLHKFPNITTTFDIGGGKYDNATEYLKSYGIKNLVYDPHNRTQEHNDTILDILLKTPKKEVLGIISNVLNVIPILENRITLLQLSNQFTIMTLITIYEGNKSGIGKITKVDCWQENRKFITYLSEIKHVFNFVNSYNNIFFATNKKILFENSCTDIFFASNEIFLD